MNYCSDCGSKLETRIVGVSWFCPNCKQRFYANPIPTIDAMLFDEHGKILLGQRKSPPNVGKLNLPGGFVDLHETLEQALARELTEELGLGPNDYSELRYAGSRVDYHEQDGKTRQLISIIMVGKLRHRDFVPNEEVTEYVWELPAELKLEDVTDEAEYRHILAAAALYDSRWAGVAQ